jgi:glycosyltransferase involved in cell wall biosynthesis
MPFLSVIIPTYHRNDLLALCLDKLSPHCQGVSMKDYEVIVSDDGSSTSAEELVRNQYPWVMWTKGPKKGPAANRNNGARFAKGEWLLFTDDDCSPTSHWIKTYQEAIEMYPRTKAFEGAIYCDNEKELSKEFAECPVNKTGNNFWSANIAVHKDLFWEVGGFDESYFLAAQEDQQLKLDIEKWVEIQFVPSSIVYHPVRQMSFSSVISRIPKQSKNFGKFAAKNKNRLGYKNLLFFYREQLVFHFYHFVKNIGSFHFLQAFISFLWLAYGVHSNAWFFVKFKK